MPPYRSIKGKMLERADDEGSLMIFSKQYKRLRTSDCVLSFPEDERLERLERHIWELYWDDPFPTQYARSKRAMNEENTPEANKSTKVLDNTVTSDTMKAASGGSASSTSKAVAEPQKVVEKSQSYAAAITAPSTESDFESFRRRRREAEIKKFGRAAVDEDQRIGRGINEKNKEAVRRSVLLPRRNGEDAFVYRAGVEWEFRNSFVGRNRKAVERTEQILDVSFTSDWEQGHYNVISIFPADWDAFAADRMAGQEKLYNAQRFLDYWNWRIQGLDPKVVFIDDMDVIARQWVNPDTPSLREFLRTRGGQDKSHQNRDATNARGNRTSTPPVAKLTPQGSAQQESPSAPAPEDQPPNQQELETRMDAAEEATKDMSEAEKNNSFALRGTKRSRSDTEDEEPPKKRTLKEESD